MSTKRETRGREKIKALKSCVVCLKISKKRRECLNIIILDCKDVDILYN